MNNDVELEKILQDLISIDTSNPPGSEKGLVHYIAKFCTDRQIPFTIVGKADHRPNLVAEIRGGDSASCLLLSSHTDTVPAPNHQQWTHPPFDGVRAEGFIWGRGALDMKYKTAFDLCLLAKYSTDSPRPKHTIRVAFVADEEQGGAFGSRYLTAHHRGLIAANYCLNELGGFPFEIFGQTVVPIQVGEKSALTIELTTYGDQLHASCPPTDTALSRMNTALSFLSSAQFQFALCQTAERFFRRIAECLPPELSTVLIRLLDPRGSSTALVAIPDPTLQMQLRAMLTNTCTPTILQSGVSSNVLPPKASLTVDCRLIPGVNHTEWTEKLTAALAPSLSSYFQFDQVGFQKGYEISADHPLVTLLSETVQKEWADVRPGLVTVPYLMPGGSDNSAYHDAGIPSFGFSPLLFEPDFPGFALSHGIDERVSVQALRQGYRCYAAAVDRIVQRTCVE